MLDMTRGEWGLFLFIFALIYAAPWVPRLGRALGRALGGDSTASAPGSGAKSSDRGPADQEPS